MGPRESCSASGRADTINGLGGHPRNFLNSLFCAIINGWTEAYQGFRSYYCSKFRRRPPICSYNGLILFLSLIFPCRTQYHRTSLHPMTYFPFSPNLQLHIRRPIVNILFKPRGSVINYQLRTDTRISTTFKFGHPSKIHECNFFI